MKKLALAVSMMALASTPAFAGGVGGVVVEPDVVAVPVVAGSSLGTAGLIGAGVAALVVIALVANNSNDDDATATSTTGSDD